MRRPQVQVLGLDGAGKHHRLLAATRRQPRNGMANNEAALAAKLAALVVPNWPTVRGTDISVMDMVDCARRGTAEQQQVAKQARDVMAQILELEEDAPVRLLLDTFCRPFESRGSNRWMELEEGKIARTRQGRQLPNELVLRVLHFLLPDSDTWPRDIEVATLGCMRAVSKSIKDLAQTQFPNTLHRYVARVTRKILHGGGSDVYVSRLAHASAPLFKRCKELRIWVAGDELDKLNNLMEVFESMETLVVYVTSDEALFSGVNLTVCHSLRCVRVEGIDMSEELEDGNYKFRILGDTYVERPIDKRALNSYKGDVTSVPGNVRLELVETPFDSRQLCRSLGSIRMLSEINFKGNGTAAYAAALGLRQPHGPARMSFRGDVDEETIEILDLGKKEDLKELSARCREPIDPAVLSLKKNKSLRSLVTGRLQSAKLDLDFNKHLCRLGLWGSFRRLDAEGVAAALRQLGTQLAVNTTLSVLLLGNNKITDEAVFALRLSENKGLKKLSLAQNKITDAGLRAALDGNTTLELVDVRWNDKVTEACAEELAGMGRRIIARGDDRTWEEENKDEE